MGPGDVIAQTYEVVRRLGAGGMGAVYEARHLRLPKRVAMFATSVGVTSIIFVVRRGASSDRVANIETDESETKRPSNSAMSPIEKLAALDVVVAALAHPARRQILLTLHFRGGTATAGEIAGRFEHAWPTTTRHLRVLEDAGLLAHEKVGRTRRYRSGRERLGLVTEWLGWFDT